MNMAEVIMAEDKARLELLESQKKVKPLTDKEEREREYLERKLDCIRRGVRY